MHRNVQMYLACDLQSLQNTENQEVAFLIFRSSDGLQTIFWGLSTFYPNLSISFPHWCIFPVGLFRLSRAAPSFLFAAPLPLQNVPFGWLSLHSQTLSCRFLLSETLQTSTTVFRTQHYWKKNHDKHLIENSVP